MRKLRYAIAAIFFAASVGCLALWWRSMTYRDLFNGPSFAHYNQELGLGTSQGMAIVNLASSRVFTGEAWRHSASDINDAERKHKASFVAKNGRFTTHRYGDGITVYFPLWYPALVFALAGVGVLRFRRQFSIRSVLVSLAVVAALLGMVVAL